MSSSERTTQSFKLTEKQRDLRDMLTGPAKHTLLYGGSRSGKTFLLCYAVIARCLLAPGSRHGIFRRHGVTAKQAIAYDTMPKVLSLSRPGVPFRWYEQDGMFSVGDGAEVWIAGLDDKERVDKVLGKEFATLYTNEASEVQLSSYDVLQTRLAQKVETVTGGILPLRDYLDLNPTVMQHWTYQIFVAKTHPEGGPLVNPADYQYGIANPRDNADNLTPDYLQTLATMPERQRRRFWDGAYSSDDADALWRREFIRRARLPDSLARIVVAIDPATTNQAGSDETGIICMGVDKSGSGYVLADESGRYRPEEWARKALELFDTYGADRVIAEVNQGGDMVEAVLRSQRPNVPYRKVSATRGKAIRAEPVAALYERGKMFHVGEFQELEDQMCSFTIAYDRKATGVSPDRVDALVWAATALFPQMTRGRLDAEIAERPRRSGDYGFMQHEEDAESWKVV